MPSDTPVVESIAAVIPSEMKDDRQGESSWERGIRQAKEVELPCNHITTLISPF